MNRAVLVILAAVLAGALLRLPHLAVRPMHTDEAVHAVKFGALLESGEYRYDRHEYHGPTLNYITLLPAWLDGKHRLADLQEENLRIVPAVCGILLVALFLFLHPARSYTFVWAAIFAAVSPAMVFYSRYYIQEMLLVFFTLGLAVGVYRYQLSRRAVWAVVAGIAAGLMYASKETSIITFGVIGAACCAVVLLRRRSTSPVIIPGPRMWLLFACAALTIIVLFFSSFGTHPSGVADAFSTFSVYFNRAGTDGPHRHPWYFYAGILGWTHTGGGPVWTEAGILLLAAAGFVRTWRERLISDNDGATFRLIVAISTPLMLVIISALPYKTPWVVLSALLGLIIMAGSGMEWLIAGAGRMRPLLYLAAGAVVMHLGWEAYQASVTFADDPRNPYVYAQAGQDVVAIGRAVTDIAKGSPDSLSVVVCYQDGEYWPMPWYLRTITRTGWWNAVPDTLPSADVVLVSPELEPALIQALYNNAPPGRRHLYVPLFDHPMYVRPGKELRVYATLDLRELTAGGGRR
jgi:uncharacterized protein (TIGR03663 family)